MTSTRPRYSRLVAALPAVVPFVPPEALERQIGAELRLRIGANESNFGPSPKAVAAMTAAAARVNWYCDPEGHVLREAIAARHGIRRDNVVLGAGIDDLLGLVVRTVIDPGDAVVMSHGAYPTFAFHVNGFGGKLVTVPYRDDRNDPEALAAAAQRSGARLLYLSNPDNPTGSWLRAAAQTALLAALPEGCLLVLDEAYADFAPADAVPETAAEDPRLIRMRTFSKAHGMAGARIGYAIAPAEMVRSFDKIRHHFGVNRVAQEGALASLGDAEFIASVRREVEAGKRHYERLAAALGLKALPSATNFVAIDCGRAERAKAILAALLEKERVFIRMPGVAPLNRCIRVSVGTEAERRLFGEALERVLADIPA
ncbi:MAG TPA: pyridoxal phosphate-dependent aminotransferase [Stellaceae bacterium]|nr:pyridoxal phosphate-dependent aminotransferase [Stellaceae bacterium]